MKRITICIDDATLKTCRKIQAEAQVNQDMSVSLSNIINSCCIVAVAHNKIEVKNEANKHLKRVWKGIGQRHLATIADLVVFFLITSLMWNRTVQNVEVATLVKLSRNRIVADNFAKKYNGLVIGSIKGNKGRAGWIVEINECTIHLYLINVWHNNRKSISINTIQLQNAIDSHALILMSYQGKEFVAHSINWEFWAKQDNAYAIHTKFGTTEVFCKTDNFRILDLDKHKIEDYYPD